MRLRHVYGCIRRSYGEIWILVSIDLGRWEQLIIQYIPYLTKFTFTYTEDIDHIFQMTSSHLLLNSFTSSFEGEGEGVASC
jgi:hypothetical protein